MAFLDRINALDSKIDRWFAGDELEERNISSLPWGSWGDEGQSTWAGIAVTPNSSLQLMAVYGSVRLISDSISTLPIDVYRQGDPPIETTAPTWLTRPTADLDFAEWCGQVLASLLLHGNAYLYVIRNATGSIVELIVLNPATVAVRRNNGRKVYTIDGVDRPSAEVVHIKGLMLPGSDVGLSPIEYARQSIGLGLAATQYGSQFFDGDGNMPGVIELPKPAQPDTMTNLARQWQRKRRTGGKGLPGVLPDGAQWKATGVTNEQAQFLATRNFTAAEIAGQMFLVDPSDLGIPVQGTSLTYANLEQRTTRRVQVTLLPWIIRLENALSALLAQPRYVKFNVSGLLRGDTRARWDTYYLAEQINQSAAARGDKPVLSTGEMRDFEEYGPAPATPTPPVVTPNPAPEVPNAAA
jgi:HK97 family phage portal protein